MEVLILFEVSVPSYVKVQGSVARAGREGMWRSKVCNSCHVSGFLDVPDALPPGKRLRTHFIGRWVGPMAGLDVGEKRGVACLYENLNSGRPACSPAVCGVCGWYLSS
jgi:hypothetical protein